MTDTGDSNTRELEAEVQALRTENDRLRSLLGLDQPSRQRTRSSNPKTLTRASCSGCCLSLRFLGGRNAE